MAVPSTDSTDHPSGNRLVDDEFVRLFMQHQRALFVYLRTIVRDRTDAEEVMQETSMVLWYKRHQFVPGTSFIKWALTVAHYEILKFRRIHRRGPQVIDDQLLERLATEMVTYYDLFEARRRALKQCLDKLDKHDRNLVNVVYSVSATKKEASHLLGMTPGGLYKALVRVRQKLHRCIQRRLMSEGLS